MYAEDFLNALDSAKIEPVYLFVGDSAFLMEQAWKKLLSCVLPRGQEIHGERVQARETEAGDLIERLGTMSMFGGMRLVMETMSRPGEKGTGRRWRLSCSEFLPLPVWS